MPATITLKNIPDDIYARLKEAARARQLRQNNGAGKFCAAEIDKAIEQGRP